MREDPGGTEDTMGPIVSTQEEADGGASLHASLTMSLEPARLSSSPHTLRSSVHMGLVEGSWIMCKQCGVGREKSHRKHSRNSGIYGSSSYC